jgi:hypothetical protein
MNPCDSTDGYVVAPQLNNHAIQFWRTTAPLLHDSNGRDTTMLFGFTRDLLRLRKQLGMRRALIVMGDPGSCMPGPLASDTKDLLKRLRVRVVYAKDVRVGDLCAALAPHCNWIVTGCKAMLQLINHRCSAILQKERDELDVITGATIKGL